MSNKIKRDPKIDFTTERQVKAITKSSPNFPKIAAKVIRL